MLTIADLAKETGYKEHQIRERLDAFNALLSPLKARGRNGIILLDKRVINIFLRAKQLEEQNLGLSQIRDVLLKEREVLLRHNELTLSQAEAFEPQALLTKAPTSETALSGSQALIEELRQEISFLREQIRFKDEQIGMILRALPPARNTEQKPSRWQLLKQFLRGG